MTGRLILAIAVVAAVAGCGIYDGLQGMGGLDMQSAPPPATTNDEDES